MRPLLSQECAPADEGQCGLTTEHLLPASETLRDGLLALRRDVDAAIAAQVRFASRKAYPLGCCHEITVAVLERLPAALLRPRAPGLVALARFIAAGGRIRHVWGVLRERYFQNALQMGTLYVDVANDTVDPMKPAVEILPFEDADFAAVRGPEHFARIAACYWKADSFANHAIPELAPLLPIITCVPGEAPRLQSVTDYMTDLFRRDGFLGAETWLAAGPAPPSAVVDELGRRWRGAFKVAREAADGRAGAVEACRAARSAGLHRDMSWRNARIADYARAFGQPAGESPA